MRLHSIKGAFSNLFLNLNINVIYKCILNVNFILIEKMIGKNEFQLPTNPPIKVTIERTSSINSLCQDSLFSTAQPQQPSTAQPPLNCKICAQQSVGGGVGLGVGSANATAATLKTNNTMKANQNPIQAGIKPCAHSTIPTCLAHQRASSHSLYHPHSHLCHHVIHQQSHICNNNNNGQMECCDCENCTQQANIEATTNANQSNNEDTNEPKATYSYLKSYFVSMLQPSDNKLAMKLFGSKKGVLKEKLRQQEVGHWIIHPCSNFRYFHF